MQNSKRLKLCMEKEMANQKGNIELIRLNMKCPACGHTWGVRISDVSELDNPNIYMCVQCARNSSAKEEKVNYEYATNPERSSI